MVAGAVVLTVMCNAGSGMHFTASVQRAFGCFDLEDVLSMLTRSILTQKYTLGFVLLCHVYYLGR